MALLIREHLTSRDASSAVRFAAEAFRRFLPENAHVWFRENANRESYLIVMLPTAGVLFLDCPAKAGSTVRRRCAQARRSPDSFAVPVFLEEECADFARKLRIFAGGWEVPLSTTLAWPLVSLGKVSGDKMSEMKFHKDKVPRSDALGWLLQDDFGPIRLATAVTRVLTRKDASPRSLLPQEQDAIRSILNPGILIGDILRKRPFCSASLAAGEKQEGAEEGKTAEDLQILDCQQEQIVYGLPEDSWVIRGVPGSGKTLVLLLRALLLTRLHPDWKVLLLCSNKQLVKDLADHVASSRNVRVIGFADFGYFFERGAPFSMQGGWEGESADALYRAVSAFLRRRPEFRKYDAVFVDGAEDIEDSGLEMARDLLRPNRNNFMIAVNPTQSPRIDYSKWVSRGVADWGHKKSLTHNYRSTCEIRDFCWNFFASSTVSLFVPEMRDMRRTTLPERHVRTGPFPRVLACQNKEEEVACAVAQLQRWYEEGFSWSSWTVILFSPDYQSLVESACARAGIPVTGLDADFGEGEKRNSSTENKVLVVCANEVRGLSFSRVLIVGANEFDVSRDLDLHRHFLFMVMGRAMEDLVIILSGTGGVRPDLERSCPWKRQNVGEKQVFSEE